MKQYILTGLALAVASFIFAQTNVNIEIIHELNGSEFNFNQTGTNNLGDEFEVERLEYYLSQFSVTHDGGLVTEVADLYFLANAGSSNMIGLGQMDVTTIESITFFVGVDPGVNHDDPASWPFLHPLAPKNPSMHWGWAAGYRFLAIEGTYTDSNQGFELHCLNDNNYFSVTTPVNVNVSTDDITIVVSANCENILKDIDISQAPIVHGGLGEAQDALVNMANDVFEYSSTILSMSENFPNVSVNLFPNPTIDGNGSIEITGLTKERIDLEIFDIVGKTVFEANGITLGKTTDFQLSKSGMYVVRISTNGVTIATQKLVVQ